MNSTLHVLYVVKFPVTSHIAKYIHVSFFSTIPTFDGTYI